MLNSYQCLYIYVTMRYIWPRFKKNNKIKKAQCSLTTNGCNLKPWTQYKNNYLKTLKNKSKSSRLQRGVKIGELINMVS